MIMKVRRCLLCSTFIFLLILVIYFVIYVYVDNLRKEIPLGDIYRNEDEEDEARKRFNPEEEKEKLQEKIDDPIIIWWTGFTGETGTRKQCGRHHCFFTVNRHYMKHPSTMVFMFYGTDFKGHDLPLPRLPNHEWALLHEESPKNNYLFSFADVMTLFNHTCTFKRESHYPITTQYLQNKAWLEKKDYMVSIEDKNRYLQELSPLIYTHSDCNVPSDRDSYVKLLSNFISVDSYGSCVHNKDLPENLKDPIAGMFHKDFYNLSAKYKFTLAMENGICDDYITEKIWRPLMLGSVPVILGSPKIKDLLPSNKSAIIITDFDSVESLAKYLKYLNENDAEYEKYLEWKKTGITNPFLLKHINDRDWSANDEESNQYVGFNFIDGFECFVCKRIHDNIRRSQRGEKIMEHWSTVEHYGCPQPLQFDTKGLYREKNDHWWYEYNTNKYYANSIRHHVIHNIPLNKSSLFDIAQRMQHDDLR